MREPDIFVVVEEAVRLPDAECERRSAGEAVALQLNEIFCCRGSGVGCNAWLPQAARLPLQEELIA